MNSCLSRLLSRTGQEQFHVLLRCFSFLLLSLLLSFASHLECIGGLWILFWSLFSAEGLCEGPVLEPPTFQAALLQGCECFPTAAE